MEQGEEISGALKILQGAKKELAQRGDGTSPDLVAESTVTRTKSKQMFHSLWDITAGAVWGGELFDPMEVGGR